MTFETDNWPFIPAKYFKDTNTRTVRLVVIHDMEAPEKATTAEAVARYFASGSVQASAHLCIDNDSIVQGVRDGDVAYAAPGANSDGLQLELAGYARQTAAEWQDAYSKATLENAAKATAQYCLKFGIPAKHLTNAELGAGNKGIVGHRQVSAVYKKSSHTDPGTNFPWTYFIGRVNHWLPYYKNGRKWPAAPAPAPTPTPTTTTWDKAKIDRVSSGMQHAVHLPVDSNWGPETDLALARVRAKNLSTRASRIALQKNVGASPDGVWGPASQAAYVETTKEIQGVLAVTKSGNWDAKTTEAFKIARGKCYLKY